MAVAPDFWRQKTVLLTGHTGFKGAWLSLWLQRLGVQLIGFSLEPPTSPSVFELAGVKDGMTSVHGDVRDLDAVVAAVQRHRPTVIIHMAAQSLVRRSYEDPVGTYTTNVTGTVHVLEAARLAPGVRVVVSVTSDKCYENSGHSSAFVETDAMGGHDPYSSSKGCAELVTAAYRRSYFSNPGAPALASARAGNVIGSGDWATDRLIPDLVKAFMERRPALIRQPGALRPWQHVLEPLAGYLLLVQRLWEDGAAYAGGWNFGPDPTEVKPVAWVADRMAALWSADAQWTQAPGRHPHEAPALCLDSGKAKQRLHWHPRLSMDEALAWTAAGYQAHARGHSLRGLIEQQIDRYQALP